MLSLIICALCSFLWLSKVFVEPLESARPCEFGGSFVITRRGVVMKAVLFTVVHVGRVHVVVRLERRLVSSDAGVYTLVISGVLKQQRRGNLRDIINRCLTTVECNSRIQVFAKQHSQLVYHSTAKTETNRAEFAV